MIRPKLAKTWWPLALAIVGGTFLWGIAIAGALLLVLTLASAYLAGLHDGAKAKAKAAVTGEAA